MKHPVVVEGYTEQLKQSGYNYKETKDIIQSGYMGLKRKKERREKLGLPLHREGHRTLGIRTRKKILDKRMWYRREKETEENSKTGGRKETQQKRRKQFRKGTEKHEKKRVEIKSVIFVQ